MPMALNGKSNTFILAYQTIGMVYGGLSITPLYLFSSLPFQASTKDDFLGLLSIIFWTFTLIGGVKYVLIVLHADDYGEGGTFALYTLLCKHVNMPLARIDQVQDDNSNIRSTFTSWIEKNTMIKKCLFGITMLATCMVIGDGILTPAISVISAVEGLKIVSPTLSQGVIMMLCVILLVGIFLLQRSGTQHISFLFSPIIATWLLVTPLIGLYNILKHQPTIFKALSPYYIIKLFLVHGKMAWLTLGGTTLCITGVEAMFADLGHFNKQSMQLGFLLAVYPSNMITYAGLAAYLVNNPQHQRQAFFKSTPRTIFWPMFFLSTFAAIVASQGLILACFSLIKQCVGLDCFPQVEIIHTSTKHRGQVYSPQVNFTLMVLCIMVVLGFQNGSCLGNAYGVAVILVMLTTTLLVTMVMLLVWRINVATALLFFLFFASLELCYLTAMLSKLPKGGWLPFFLALLVTLFVFTWVQARAKLSQFEISHSVSSFHFANGVLKNGICRVPGILFLHNLSYASQIQPPTVFGFPPKISCDTSPSTTIFGDGQQDPCMQEGQNAEIHTFKAKNNAYFIDTLGPPKEPSIVLPIRDIFALEPTKTYNHVTSPSHGTDQCGTECNSFHIDLERSTTRDSQHFAIQDNVEGLKLSASIPPILQHYVQNTQSLHRVVVLARFEFGEAMVPKSTQIRFTHLDERIPMGVYVCTIQLGFMESIHDQCKGIFVEMLNHLEEFIGNKVVATSQESIVQLAGLAGQVANLEKTQQVWREQILEVQRAKQESKGLISHMVCRPKIRLSSKWNLLWKFLLLKLYPILQFYDPLSPILSQLPSTNLLEMNMTYDL